MKICPLFSIMNKEESPCIKGACMWYVPEHDARQTPAECLIASMSRNILDIGLIIEKFKGSALKVVK